MKSYLEFLTYSIENDLFVMISCRGQKESFNNGVNTFFE